MNLLMRLIRIIVAAYFKSKLDLLEESIVLFRVYPHDLDINLHMTNSRYCSLMDLGRLDLILRGPYATAFFKREWQSVLGGITLRFRRPIYLFETIELRSRIVGWDEKWFFIEQSILKDGDVKCIALAKCLLLSHHQAVTTQHVFKLHAPDQNLPSVQLTSAIQDWLAYEDKTRFFSHNGPYSHKSDDKNKQDTPDIKDGIS